MRTVVLDFRDFHTREEVHTFLALHLDFPDYYGKNLDALYDVLVSDDRPTNILLLPSGKDWETGFLSTIRDAAEENPHLSVAMRP